MGKYAATTGVASDQTRVHLESTLLRYGADSVGVITKRDAAMVLFEFKGLGIRIEAPLPAREDFVTTGTGRERRGEAADRAYDQAVKQRWRVLLLAIKAKLEVVECGISTVETEFMPFVVMKDGRTMAQHVLPLLAEAGNQGSRLKQLPNLALGEVG